MNRAPIALCSAMAVLVLAAPAPAAVKAKLTAPTHAPKVGQTWRWTLTVVDGKGKPVAGKARVQLVAFGTVVGCWKGGQMRQCTGQGATAGDLLSFRGRKTGTIRWTAESRSVPLTFQAVLTAGGKTTKLRYRVTVR